MPRRFSFRPSLTVKGRRSLGLRGFVGKPFHPPLTDVPIGAYVLVAGFDVLSVIGGDSASWAGDLYTAGTWALAIGFLVSLGAALTGFLDWKHSTAEGTQARRTVNAHAWTMIAVTVLVVIDLALRLSSPDEAATPIAIAAVSVVAVLLTIVGGAIGGTLVFDYGFNVKTAGDSPVWHPSERDLMPGEKP